jgi:hypothetical protein
VAGVHARIAPSALATIVACHAHGMMAAPYADEPPTPEQLEGDAGHWVALQYVSGNEVPVGAMTPQGLAVDEDMVDGALLWVATVGLYGFAEMPVVCERIHPTDCWGTPDWWRADEIERILRVKDYKYGHRFVDAFENWQLIAYAVGLLDTLGLSDLEWIVELQIVQPRNYQGPPVRTWRIRASDLRAYVNIARHAAERALMPDPVASVGPHCLDCPARHECKTLQHTAMHVVEYAGTAERVNLNAMALAAELSILERTHELLEARLTGLQEQAMARIRRGELVPGHAIAHPPGRLVWNHSPDEVAAMGDMFKVDLRKGLAVMTPTQAVKAGLDEAVRDTYASRPPGKAKLVTETTTQARKVFGANTP